MSQAQRLAIHRHRRAVSGRRLPSAQPPADQPVQRLRVHPLQRPPDGRLVRRGVPAGIGARPRPSLASCSGVNSRANSPISVHERAPDPTAATAMASSDTNECRTPLRSRGSASSPSRPSNPSRASVAACSTRPSTSVSSQPIVTAGCTKHPSNSTNQHNRSTTLNGGSFTSSPEPWGCQQFDLGGDLDRGPRHAGHSAGHSTWGYSARPERTGWTTSPT
jgi:hypothetical protein